MEKKQYKKSGQSYAEFGGKKKRKVQQEEEKVIIQQQEEEEKRDIQSKKKYQKKKKGRQIQVSQQQRPQEVLIQELPSEEIIQQQVPPKLNALFHSSRNEAGAREGFREKVGEQAFNQIQQRKFAPYIKHGSTYLDLDERTIRKIRQQGEVSGFYNKKYFEKTYFDEAIVIDLLDLQRPQLADSIQEEEKIMMQFRDDLTDIDSFFNSQTFYRVIGNILQRFKIFQKDFLRFQPEAMTKLFFTQWFQKFDSFREAMEENEENQVVFSNQNFIKGFTSSDNLNEIIQGINTDERLTDFGKRMKQFIFFVMQIPLKEAVLTAAMKFQDCSPYQPKCPSNQFSDLVSGAGLDPQDHFTPSDLVSVHIPLEHYLARTQVSKMSVFKFWFFLTVLHRYIFQYYSAMNPIFDKAFSFFSGVIDVHRDVFSLPSSETQQKINTFGEQFINTSRVIQEVYAQMEVRNYESGNLTYSLQRNLNISNPERLTDRFNNKTIFESLLPHGQGDSIGGLKTIYFSLEAGALTVRNPDLGYFSAQEQIDGVEKRFQPIEYLKIIMEEQAAHMKAFYGKPNAEIKFFVKVTLFYINVRETIPETFVDARQAQTERTFFTISFMTSLERISQQHIKEELYDYIIGKWEETLIQYEKVDDPEEDETQNILLQCASVIDHVTVFAIPKNKMRLNHEVYVDNFNKQNVQSETIYKRTKLPEYNDQDEVGCISSVISFILGFISVAEFLISTAFTLHFSPIIHNLNKCLGLCHQKYKKQSLLIFPQSEITQAFFDEVPHYFVYSMQSHCWIGKFDETLTYFNDQKFVFKLPVKKQSKGQKSRVTHCREIFYDIETLGNNNQKVPMKPILLCFLVVEHGKPDKEGTFFGKDCMKKFADMLLKLDSKTLVYAHNGSRFDHIYLIQEFQKSGVKSQEIGGTSTNIKFFKYKNLVLRDTALLMPDKLKNLGSTFKVKHMKLDFPEAENLTEEFLENEENKNKLIKYCQHDVLCLREILDGFFETIKSKLPQFERQDIKQTLPATAQHIFSRFFLKQEQLKMNFGIDFLYGNNSDSNGIRVQEMERKSYHGGLCQVFNHSLGKDLAYYDFCSMYASILDSEKFPLSQGQLLLGLNLNIESPLNEFYLYGVTEFEFDSPITNFPVPAGKNEFIYVREHRGETIYLWGREIIFAKKLGLKMIKIQSQVKYEIAGNVFSSYMQFFFNIKKENNEDKALRTIAKLFCNSLYGKFGQKPAGRRVMMSRQEASIMGLEGLEEKFMTKKQKIFNQMNLNKNDLFAVKFIEQKSPDLVEIEFFPDESRLDFCGSLIRLASYTTMLGRCWLLQVLLDVGYENCFYCDTDSLVFKAGCENKIKSFKIGNDLRCIANVFEEGQRIIEADFVAPKCYYCILDKPYKGSTEYIRCKGIRKTSIEDIRELREKGQCQMRQKQFFRKTEGVFVIEEFPKKLFGRQRRNINLNNGQTFAFQNLQNYFLFNKKILTRQYSIDNNLYFYNYE